MSTPTRRTPSDASHSPEALSRWIATLLDDAAADEQRAAAEAALGRTTAGRRALDALAARTEPADAGVRAARVDRTMAALTALAPADMPRVADLVLEAWRDPALREAVRRDPSGALRDRGVDVPAGVVVSVVEPKHAEVPSADRVELPLPPTGAPSVPAEQAARALASSAFGPLLATTSGSGAEPRVDHPRVHPAWPRRALALAALAAGIALALAMPLAAPGDDASGAALGAPAAAALLLVLGVAAAAAAWWLRRR